MKKMRITGNKQCFFEFVLHLLFLSLKLHLSKGSGSDSISIDQSLSGNQRITSSGGVFGLGFFTPGNSRNYYIGVWYNNIPDLSYQTVVWVLNRRQPVSNPSSSSLKLLQDGNLVLLDHFNTTIWSTESTSNAVNSTIALLLDNGNFVIRDIMDSSIVLWQSFDHPTDTWLPGARLGYNKLTNEKRILTSWINPQNPAPGPFSLEVDPNGSGRFILRNGPKLFWMSGRWEGRYFKLLDPEMQMINSWTYVTSDKESYFTYSTTAALTRFTLDFMGWFDLVVYNRDQIWGIVWSESGQQCEVDAFCGAFSCCNQRSRYPCDCLKGFEPKIAKDWGLGDHSNGCERKTPLQCNNRGNDAFFMMSNMQFPKNSESLVAASIEDCKSACLSNCSCTAFAYDNGCLIWKGDLFSLQQFSTNEKIGRDFHLRISASEPLGTRHGTKRKFALIVIAAASVSFILIGLVSAILWRKFSQSAGALEAGEGSLVLFKYKDLRRATKRFSEKLGEGSFGSVFKGTLPNSIVVAVKKLKILEQGEKQFRSEVRTIGTIQHINLVRLCGFCAEGSKRFLVYDYMPNGSLDAVLFQNSTKVLDWKTRYNIAVGTARALAYLHEKCIDCIIHFDIKPENILLDAACNPKVADFGLAKLLGREFSRVLTTMRGTRGYLAPEWISGGAITSKADVYSYGKLLFEIISGRRNLEQLDDELCNYFPCRVAKTISKGEDITLLLDCRLNGSANMGELSTACKVACWCIQDDEKDRPTMGQVVLILEGLLEVSIPPIPRYFQQLAQNPGEAVVNQEKYYSSDETYDSSDLGDELMSQPHSKIGEQNLR